MTHLRRSVARSALVLGAAFLVVGVGGCEKKQAQRPAPPVVAPPRPALAPLEDLEMDPRVQFPQSREPSTRELAEGIAQLASSIVSGDEASLAEVLDENGNAVLNALVDSGMWSKESGRIEAVRVCVLSEEENGSACQLGLGVQDSDGAYLLAWSGQKSGETWVFAPAPIRYITGDQLAALDDAALTAPTLPEPVRLEVDPAEMNRKPIERFSK